LTDQLHQIRVLAVADPYSDFVIEFAPPVISGEPAYADHVNLSLVTGDEATFVGVDDRG